ncbi:Myc-type, basic helix-loop-helix domain-containing protein [Tanacetum coccineum]
MRRNIQRVGDDDDDVVVSDDDEVNPSTNVEEVFVNLAMILTMTINLKIWRAYFQITRWGCGGSPLDGPTRPVPASDESSSLRIETGNASLRRAVVHISTGDYSSMLNSLMGETVKYLPLACEWEEIPEAYKAHIFPTLENAAEEARNDAEEARNHLPPKKVWGDRTEDEWNTLVDWWSHPDRVARSLQNAANRAKNTILTHQGKKSFAQGRNEYKVQKGHYEDLIETWRKTHSRPETGEFKTEKNRKRYAFPDPVSREELDRILRQKDQEAELLRKQTAEAQQRAYLAALKADAAYQNIETMYGAVGEYFSNYAPNPTRPFMPPSFARPTMPQLSPEWAHLLNPPFPYNQPLQPSYAGPSQYPGPPGYTGPPRYPAPLQPLQPPYVGQFPFTPVNNNTFNNCYNPVMNSNLASTSNSQLPRFITNPHNNDTRSVDELARDRELAGEDNDVGDNNEEGDNQQSGGDYSEDEEGDNEEVQNESEESD